MAFKLLSAIKKYHEHLVIQAQVTGGLVAYQTLYFQLSYWSVPVLLGLIVAISFGELTHLNYFQQTLIVLPFAAVTVVGAGYVIVIFFLGSVWPSILKSKVRGPWNT